MHHLYTSLLTLRSIALARYIRLPVYPQHWTQNYWMIKIYYLVNEK